MRLPNPLVCSFRSQLVSCLVLLALAPEGRAQEPWTRPVERPGHGRPTAGLGREFHAGRRQALREKLKSGVVVVRGLPETRDYVRFHQDKVFWWLTGVNSPDAALVMDCDSGAEMLFLPKPNVMGETWEGEKWDSADGWVADLVGFKDVRPIGKLEESLAALLPKARVAWISRHPNLALSGGYDRARPYDSRQARDPFDGRKNRETALAEALESKFGCKAQDCSPQMAELRLIKQPEELAAIRRASRAGALAMAEAIRSTRAGLGEWEIEALMSFVQIREGATGPAYHGIVGSGPNSLTLHYSSSSRAMNDGEVLLVDYAPEVDHFVSDVTRTWPVNGKFSARQAELYDAVLAAQQAGIDVVKPGKTIADVQKACDDVLVERGFGDLRRHGVSHWVGMEVHDVGGLDRPLEPGMVFTIEPGLYEPATNIGVRIEDVVVVTAKGCEVVTADVPRERAAIERLWAERGWLDHAPRN
jgi:Xaa-Pro aminopeptidase